MGRSIRPYDEGDVMAFGFSAGGAGYGDPLEADPEDVARDFAGGLISAWTMREIYKVAYDEVEELVLAERDRGAARPRSARRGRRATATGRRSRPPGRSSRRPRTCSSGSAPGPRASPRRRSCGCERARARGRALAGRPARPPAAGAAVRGAGGGGRGAAARELPRRPRPSRADLRGPRALAARRRADRRRAPSEAPDVLADLLRRVRAVVPEPTLLGVTVTGPATTPPASRSPRRRAASSRPRAAPPRRAPSVVFVRESGEAAGGLRAAGHAAVGLAEVLPRRRRAAGAVGARTSRGPFLPCVTRAARAPARARRRARRGAAARRTARRSITHTEDLAGHVPVRELQSAVARLRS